MKHLFIVIEKYFDFISKSIRFIYFFLLVWFTYKKKRGEREGNQKIVEFKSKKEKSEGTKWSVC